MSQKAEKYARSMERRMTELEDRFFAAVHTNQLRDATDYAAANRKARGRARQAENTARKWRCCTWLAVIALMLCVALCLTIKAKAQPELPVVVDELMEPEGFENEKIEAALYDSGSFYADVPLDGDTQALLRSACEESSVDYNLALAVIWKETGYQNITGDDGASTGYMQVQERWHKDRMTRLGVTDLSDPYGNFRVGCDYLAELLGKYPLAEALTAYNCGSSGQSEYANDVIGKLGELEGETQ